MFLGQMLKVCGRVAGPLSTIQRALVVIGGYVQDYIPGRVQPQDLAGNTLEVVPEGVLVRGKEREGEKILGERFSCRLGRCRRSFAASIFREQLLAL